MRSRKKGCNGSAILEFTLVGIPMIFVLISVFEVARGMWVYHTLAHAVKEGTRFAIVNGKNCAAIPGCTVTIADIADRIRLAGVGLAPNELEVRLTSMRQSSGGGVVVNGTPVNCTPLSSCLSRSSQPGDVWPPGPGNRPKMDSVLIEGTYPFRSAIAMFWPGAGRGMKFAAFWLPASSMEVIQF